MKISKVSRRSVFKGAAGTAMLPLANVVQAQAASRLAGYPAPITSICWGCKSHWLQPWRELCYTRSFSVVESRIGVVQDLVTLPQSAFNMLRQNGFRTLRVEMNWGNVEPTREQSFTNQTQIVTFLQQVGKAGLRPLILLNANSGYPCPLTKFNVTVTQNAAAGASVVTLATTDGLIIGRSGFTNLDPSKLAGILVTGINGQEVTLSQPLPAALAAGKVMPFVTLNYEPFSLIGSDRYQRTMQGWLKYVDLVCETVTAALGTANCSDRGFDLEIWNELTFGSYFLDINNYYNPALLNPVSYNYTLTWADIVLETANHIAASGQMFEGVRITDGFANTIPWPASSQEPARVTAISKHAYPPIATYPQDQQSGGRQLDANFNTATFIPTYQEYHPEYIAGVTQTESLVRDVSFRPNQMGAAWHGRLARVVRGQPSPVDVWITETGCAPNSLGITDPTAADRIQTLFTLRSIFFFLGIGVDRVYIYEGFGPTDSFALANQSTPTVAGTALLCLGRMISAIKGTSFLSNAMSPIIVPIVWAVLRGQSDQVLFQGNGTANSPSLTTADCLVLLPFQVSANRIAIVYYVMTRDVRVPLSQQTFVVTIIGQNIQNYSVTAYDPVTDQPVAITIVESSRNSVSLQILATDIPRAMLFDKRG